VEIENKSKTSSADLTNIRRDLLDIESKVQTYAQRLMNVRGKAATETTEITNKIQEMQDKINEMFENLKKEVAKEMHSFQQQAFQDLDMKNDVCITNATNVAETLSDVENVIQQGTPSQQLIMAHHLKNRIMILKKKVYNDISELKDVNMSFDFDPSVHLPPTNNTTPGKLTLKYIPVDVTTFIDSINSQHKDQKVKLTLLASIDLKQGDGDVEEPLYLGLSFLPDGRLVAVDNPNKKCLVYNQKLEKAGSVLLPNKPFDVTVMTDTNAAVSHGTKIYYIYISKSSGVTVTRSLHVTMNCYSICMMTDDSFLVGCYNDPQPVCSVSVGGEERALSVNFPSKQYKLNESVCTFIKNRNKVVLSERYAHTVYIYDIANNTKVEVKDDKLIKKPIGMAVGPFDCIFVCSKDTNSIVQISHTGQILSSHVLDMKFPSSVCVSKDNTRLAVSNSARGKVKLQLYNIELIR
jgi:hypothetical protein